MDVLLHHRPGKESEAEKLAKQCREYGIKATPIAANLEDEASVLKMVSEMQKNDIPTGFIHVASPPIDSTLELSMQVNYKAMTTIVDSLIPIWLEAQEGRVVFLGSSAIEYNPEGWENYTVAKLAGSQYVLSLHKRFSNYGIEGRVISPGFVKTSFSDGFRDDNYNSLLPEQVSDTILDTLLNDNNMNDPYIWMEANETKRGNWGFINSSKPNISTSKFKDHSDEISTTVEVEHSFENMFRGFFNLDESYNVDSCEIGLLPEWDSLKHIELILFLEKNFGVKFDSSDMDNIKSYSGLKKFILDRIS
jgi:3-oxoacyl-[acyl-carrier protein] reductase